jgi:hypothetical protein
MISPRLQQPVAPGSQRPEAEKDAKEKKSDEEEG